MSLKITSRLFWALLGWLCLLWCVYPKVAFLHPTEPSVQLDDELLQLAKEESKEVTLNDESDSRNPRYLSNVQIYQSWCSKYLVSICKLIWLNHQRPWVIDRPVPESFVQLLEIYIDCLAPAQTIRHKVSSSFAQYKIQSYCEKNCKTYNTCPHAIVLVIWLFWQFFSSRFVMCFSSRFVID